MLTLKVSLSLAMATLNGPLVQMPLSFPVLVGVTTPVGYYNATHVSVGTPGYGGSVVVFHIDGDKVYAVHRLLTDGDATLPATRRRSTLIQSTYVGDRRGVTNGCINVPEDVFNRYGRYISAVEVTR